MRIKIPLSRTSVYSHRKFTENSWASVKIQITQLKVSVNVSFLIILRHIKVPYGRPTVLIEPAVQMYFENAFNWKYGTSRPEVLFKKGVLRNLTKFTGKHLCQSLFLNKVAGLRPATLLKKRLWYKCFPVNFVKFLRTPFYIEHL